MSIDRLEMSITNVNLLTIQELRQHLREHKLPTLGTKQQLQERLNILLQNNTSNNNNHTAMRVEPLFDINGNVQSSKLRITIEKQGSSKQCSLVTPNTVDSSKLYDQLLARAANKFRFKSKRIFDYLSGIEVLPGNIYDILYDGCTLVVTSGAVHNAVNKQLNNNSSTSPIPSTTTQSPVLHSNTQQQSNNDMNQNDDVQQQLEQFNLDDSIVTDLYSNNNSNVNNASAVDEYNQDSTSDTTSTTQQQTIDQQPISIAPLQSSATSSPICTSGVPPTRTIELLEKRCKRVEAENKQLLKQNDKLNHELSMFNTTVRHVSMMEQKITTLQSKLELATNTIQKSQRESIKYKTKCDTLSNTIDTMTQQCSIINTLQSQYDTVSRQLNILTGRDVANITPGELQWSLQKHSNGLHRVSQQINTYLEHKRKQFIEATLCKICYEGKSDFVALPCCHMYCVNCIMRIGSECSHCRRTIEEKKQVYH